MAIHNPNELDYDDNLYSQLQPRKSDILKRFFNCHADNIDHRPIADDGNFTQDELCKLVASQLEEEARNLITLYNRVKDENVRVVPAVDYLSLNYDINHESLDIENRYELLILLYEEGLVEILDELILRSKMRSNLAKRKYTLNKKLGFESLEKDLRQFHQWWNKEQEDPNALLIDKEYEGNNLVILKIYQETSMQYPNTFRFREEEKEEIPAVPKLTGIQYQQLKTIRLQIEPKEDKTELIFTESFNGWRTTLDDFFDFMFNVSEFFDAVEKATSPVAVEIEQEIVESIDRGDDPVANARSTIKEKCEEAEERINNLDIADSQKTDFQSRIETIEISGSEIEDDQSIETQEFRLIAGLDGLFNSVDIEEGFRDLLRKAESEKQSFVISISDRPVQFNNGSWDKIGPGKLPDKDQRALQIFFDGEDGI